MLASRQHALAQAHTVHTKTDDGLQNSNMVTVRPARAPSYQLLPEKYPHSSANKATLSEEPRRTVHGSFVHPCLEQSSKQQPEHLSLNIIIDNSI